MGQNPSEQPPDKKTDPWGRKINKPQGPPDLDAIVRLYKNKLAGMLGGKKNSSFNNSGSPTSTSGFLIGIAIIALILIWALSGIFIVSPAERAVITRFGKYVETVGPGPHWIPRLIKSKQTINVQRVSNFIYESEMLTKDENIVSVAVAVQYRVSDAESFLFNVVDPVRSLEQATASALRQVVGHNTLDDLLTTGRSEVRDQVTQQLQEILSSYKAGLLVTDVTLQSIKPPEAVTAAFDDAIKAREDQQAFINKAETYDNQVTAAVQGKVSRILQEAEAYKKGVVLEAQAAIAGYLAVLPEYEAAPQVTRERLYLGTLESIFSQTNKVFLDQRSGNPLVYLPLDKLLSTANNTASLSPDKSPATIAASTQVTNNPPSTIPIASPTTDVGSLLTNRPSYPLRDDTPQGDNR